MPIFDAIQAHIGQVFSSVYLDAVLYRDVITAPATTPLGKPTLGTPQQFECKAMVDEWSASHKAGSLVAVGDSKIIILQTSLATTPVAKDRITIRGETYEIVSDGGSQEAVTQDPAQGGWVCRGRKR